MHQWTWKLCRQQPSCW